MKRWARVSLAGLGAIGAGVGVALWAGPSIWKRETERIVETLKRLAGRSKTAISFPVPDDLPEPVARYLHFALKDGSPSVTTARIRHSGEFKLNDKWILFTSEQHFSAEPPGFVWDADMRMNPLTSVRVRDGYLGGRGSMTAKVLSLIPIVDARDDKELASAALQRFLAESVWFPTALFPREGLRWSPLDNGRALATLSDAGTTVSLEFSFNETGEVTEIYSPGRLFVGSDGEHKQLPWACRVFDYRERDGMMIPIMGEVEWRMPEGDAPYWKGEIVETEYEFVADQR